jgi:hypothetical protein
MKTCLSRLVRSLSFVGLALGGVFARASVVADWNAAIRNRAVLEPSSAPTFLEARMLAMTHLAMADAAMAAERAPTLQPTRAVVQRVAVATAAHDVLQVLSPSWRDRFSDLLASHLRDVADAGIRERGMSLGRAAAADWLARRGDDGWLASAQLAGTERWIAGTPEQALARGGRAPESPWRAMKPFALKAVDQQWASTPEPILTLGKVRVDERWQSAKILTAVDRSQSGMENTWRGSPMLMWNRLAESLALNAQLDLAAEARLYAALNSALADAAVAASHWRHVLGQWQVRVGQIWSSTEHLEPEMSDTYVSVYAMPAIRMQADTRRVLQPPLPNYLVESAVLAGAAQAVLERSLKVAGDPITLSGPEPADLRVFASIQAAAREATFVATLNPHHNRSACVEGYQFGRDVGTYVAKRLGMRAR